MLHKFKYGGNYNYILKHLMVKSMIIVIIIIKIVTMVFNFYDRYKFEIPILISNL